MLTAIEFDHRLSLEANEIENEVAVRMLASKLAILYLTAAQALPKAMLGICWRVSQPALQLGFENALVCLASHIGINRLINTIPTQPSP